MASGTLRLLGRALALLLDPVAVLECGRGGRFRNQELIGFGAAVHRCLGVHFTYPKATVGFTRAPATVKG